MSENSFFVWMEKHILSRIRGRMGYAVLFSVVMYIAVISTLDTGIENASSTSPYKELMAIARLGFIPAIAFWGAFVGAPRREPLNLVGQTFFFFCGAICGIAVVGCSVWLNILSLL